VAGTTNNASEVSRFDLVLDSDKNIVSAQAQIVSMSGVEPDQGLRDLEVVKTAHEKTIDFVVGNVLGHATANFQPENEIRGIPAGRIEDTAVMDLIGTVQLEYSGADVTGAALFRDTSDLPEGDLNYGNIFDIYKYANTLKTVKVTGAELKAYMEWAAECYNTWVPGDVTISFNPNKASYLHDHFSGVNYEVNLSKPAGERIENVTLNGEPVTDDQILTLCVNDYRFSGLKTAGIISGEAEWESSQSVRDMIKEYMAEHDPLDPTTIVDNNWTITGVDLQLDNPERAAYIEKVNSGELATPYNKSINLDRANNVIVDGILNDAAALSVESETGVTYYRLRDLATILKGTDAAFNVDWNGQVVITKGGSYEADALTVESIPAAETAGLTVTPLTIDLDGTAVTVNAVLYNCNYFISAEGLNTIIGTAATQADGIMTLSAKDITATGIAG
jgi:2',3'-cyclic-nucleotide 2'-phosphodiesterase/3'-nucleotidase